MTQPGESDRQLAIIKDVRCGVGDRGRAWIGTLLARSVTHMRPRRARAQKRYAFH